MKVIASLGASGGLSLMMPKMAFWPLRAETGPTVQWLWGYVISPRCHVQAGGWVSRGQGPGWNG